MVVAKHGCIVREWLHQFLVAHSVALSNAVPRQDGTAGPDKEKAGSQTASIDLSDLSKKSSWEKCRQFRW